MLFFWFWCFCCGRGSRCRSGCSKKILSFFIQNVFKFKYLRFQFLYFFLFIHSFIIFSFVYNSRRIVYFILFLSSLFFVCIIFTLLQLCCFLFFLFFLRTVSVVNLELFPCHLLQDLPSIVKQKYHLISYLRLSA
eukprot:UN25543